MNKLAKQSITLALSKPAIGSSKPTSLLCQVIILFGLSIGHAPATDIVIQPWSEGVFEQVKKEHGVEAEQRMRDIYQLILDYRNKPLMEQLTITNNTLNKLPWIADKEQWSADDYWATPFETLTKFGGDCEDMAIGKHVVLRFMGVPKKNLHLGYVIVKETGENHMVLVWVNDDRSKSLVLDNLVEEILPGSERTDLLAVYLTDADGNMIVIDDDGTKRSIIDEIDNRKLAKLEKVRQKMAANHEKYKQFNDGKPLYITN